MIPAEAVEAAAKGAYSVGKIDAGVDWDDLYPTLREVYVDMARAALEAAAPHMLAGALEDAADSILQAQPVFVASWLRASAANIRPTEYCPSLSVCRVGITSPLRRTVVLRICLDSSTRISNGSNLIGSPNAG